MSRDEQRGPFGRILHGVADTLFALGLLVFPLGIGGLAVTVVAALVTFVLPGLNPMEWSPDDMMAACVVAVIVSPAAYLSSYWLFHGLVDVRRQAAPIAEGFQQIRTRRAEASRRLAYDPLDGGALSVSQEADDGALTEVTLGLDGSLSLADEEKAEQVGSV